MPLDSVYSTTGITAVILLYRQQHAKLTARSLSALMIHCRSGHSASLLYQRRKYPKPYIYFVMGMFAEACAGTARWVLG